MSAFDDDAVFAKQAFVLLHLAVQFLAVELSGAGRVLFLDVAVTGREAGRRCAGVAGEEVEKVMVAAALHGAELVPVPDVEVGGPDKGDVHACVAVGG